METPNVLVTGSAGHLGHALMLELSKYGLLPIGIDVLTSEHTALTGSVSDRDFIRSVFERFPSVRHVLHTATLHKPHIESHTKQQFIETNIQGTLILLEEAARTGHIEGFIFTSTTSTFGVALAPRPGQPAAWIDESVTPIPKNIYGATKVAAEDLCQLVHAETGMPILVLKISRFFPELDDNETARRTYSDENLKVCELMYRRVDVADVVQAHVCAMRRAKDLRWGRYIISAPSPFQNDRGTLEGLDGAAAEVVRRVRPQHAAEILAIGWKLPERIDRVYDSSKAARELDWKAEYTFERAVGCVGRGVEWKSNLTVKVGLRGYHAMPTGVYTS